LVYINNECITVYYYNNSDNKIIVLVVINLGIVNVKMCIFMLLQFVVLFSFWRRIKKNKTNKTKLVLKMIFIIGLILIMYLVLVLKIQKFNIGFLHIILIVICGLAITLISGEVSKNIILLLMNRNFSRKYGGKELSDTEITTLRNNKKIFSLLWNYILTFIICAILYGIVDNFIFSLDNMKDTLVISLISTVSYWSIFKIEC